MFSRNFSSSFLTPTSKTPQKTFNQMKPSTFHNNLTIIARSTPHKTKTINLPATDLHSRMKYRLKNLKSARIYLTLDIKDEIEKIINEEEKKRYFNQEFHLNKNINREELKKRKVKKVPFSEISQKKLKRKFSIIKKERPKTTFKPKKQSGFNI